MPSAYPEQPAIPRIGVVVPPVANSPYETGLLRDGLRDLGYSEGKNIIVEWRRSTGAIRDQQALVTALVRSRPAVVVVFSTVAARAALEASAKTPVVFLSGDPVLSGLADSLARPGRNATGVSVVLTELTAKRLELLLEVAPRARRIACLVNSANPAGQQQLDATRKAALKLGVQIVALDARNEGELDTVLRALSRSEADGILVTGDILFRANKSKVTQAVRRARLPATFPFKEYHDDGALMSYGTDPREDARMMAGYVAKILNGAAPSDIPIEQVSKYELIIDLRVAREQGVKVPQELLLRADGVIR